MTTPVAPAVVALLVADHPWLGRELPVVPGRQPVRLIEYLAFWR